MGTENNLNRGLSNRHIQLIAIGGAIGTGLFMGSGRSISLAGPSILLVYAIIGFILFFVMRAMGEILLSNLKYKTFLDFVTDLLGPAAGFFIGWSYWFCWIVIGIADLIAIAGYVSNFSDVAPWIPALVCVLVFLAFNSLTVKLFGETEFWFSIIKIIAIVVLIGVGIYFIAIGFKSPPSEYGTGATTSLANIWNDGGIFPNGAIGFFAGFQLAVFSFVGVELVGTTAAEAKDPEITLPRAINAIPIRIILFYVLALMVIMSVIPWRSISPDQSPFIILFLFAGIPAAAGAVYFVVITSAASSANSGIFSTSRMLYGLAFMKKAPKTFLKLTGANVPFNALFFSCACLIPAVVVLYFGNKKIMDTFEFVTSIATIMFIFVWTLIIFAYMRYRKVYPERHEESRYKLPGGIAICLLCIVFFAFVLIVLAFRKETSAALMMTPLWFIFLGGSYLLIPKVVKEKWLIEDKERFKK